MRVEIRLLGGFEVVVDGVPIPDDAWRRRAPAQLVKLLALARRHRLRRERLMDSLWPDLLVENAAPRLHKAAHYARTALGESEGVVLSDDSVSLFPTAEVVVDVELFDAAVEAARAQGEPRLSAEAVELYRGELLPTDLYEPWTEEDRDRLRLTHIEMLHDLGRWDLVVAADPLDEVGHLQLIQQHIERADRRAALRQLDVMEKLWQRELGEGISEMAQALREEALALPIDLVAGNRPALSPVPVPPTRTVGRDRDISRVLEMLETSQTVTLLGPGGVGKTRLAAEVARRQVDATSVECCFVDLTKVSDPALVPGLIARELGVHVEAASDPGPAVEEALSRRSILVVLDNFEHVLDAAEIARRLADLSSDVRVLSTSRARLRIAGERVVDVAPLALDSNHPSAAGDPQPADAIVLFDQVATALDPDFRLAPNLEDVVNICRAVDGLPLAIELAAGHVRTLSPPLLRARLGARLGSAAAAPRGVPPRQQTVPATIAWSLQLLGAAEQDLFMRLGVFAGAVPLEAIEEVCGEPGSDVLDSLSRLVDHSLVRRVSGSGGETRFVLLELLRERARELLGSEPEVGADLERRHAEHVAAFLDELDETRWSEASGRWIDAITGFLAEIRRAHDWAVDHRDARLAARITAGLGTYWHREGHHAEGRRWVAEALEHQAELDDYLVARVHLSAGFVEWTQDQLLARRYWDVSLQRFRALGHKRYLSYSLAWVSATYFGDSTDYDLAMRLCEEAIALARQVGERPLLAQALNIRGELTRVHGDDDLALAAYTEGLELAEAAHDEAHVSMFLGNLSFLADHRGDYEEARDLCREAIRRSWPIGRRLVAAMAIAQLAGAEQGLGRPERGALLVGAAQEGLRRLGVTLHPGDRPELERVIAALSAELGEETYRRLSADGGGLSLDEAAMLALSDDNSQPRIR